MILDVLEGLAYVTVAFFLLLLIAAMILTVCKVVAMFRRGEMKL